MPRIRRLGGQSVIATCHKWAATMKGAARMRGAPDNNFRYIAHIASSRGIKHGG